MAQEGTGGGVHSEDDESAETDDNSLGRLLTISDGVFAIAMTLLTLDLKVPDLGRHPGDAVLRHALSKNTASYLSFLVSFYVVANYWNRHRRLMRSVVTTHPRLITCP
jgi:TMEM175 potassium channel family protein